MTYIIGGVTAIESTGLIRVQSDVDSTRPSVPVTGMLRYSTTRETYEIYNGERWMPVTETYTNAMAWGINSVGQLGDYTTLNASSPVYNFFATTIPSWVDIEAGVVHSTGISATGVAYCWGRNAEGQLGDNTTVSKSGPVSVTGSIQKWKKISGGAQHSAALTTDGNIYCWGSNGSGRLGDGTYTGRSSPTLIAGGAGGWKDVWAGVDHSAGINTAGVAFCWGNGSNGKLGNNSIGNALSPVSVVGGFTNWTQISCRQAHTVAVRANGSLWAWGNNFYGQLGNNSSLVSGGESSPVSVVGGFSDWVQAKAGNYFTLGLRANGTLWAWGTNLYGQLGNGNNNSRSSPVSVVGGFTDWVQISAGANHGAAVRANGSAWAWGRNGSGRLGDNTSTDRNSPVSVVGGITDWLKVSCGDQFTLAIRA